MGLKRERGPKKPSNKVYVKIWNQIKDFHLKKAKILLFMNIFSKF